MGVKVHMQIKHCDISYVRVIQSLAELRDFEGRDDQPKAYVIWEGFLFGDKQELWNKSSISCPASLTAFHAIIVM